MTPQHWKVVLPLIQAFANGQTIQSKAGEVWRDADPKFGLAFNADISNYRIKPATIKSRRYLWKAPSGIFILNIQNMGSLFNPETYPNSFVKWIDEDWVEHELPTETTS